MLMPQVKQIKRINKDFTDICEKHKDCVLEYYCHSHDVVGCLKCKKAEHRNCKEIDLISEVASSFSSSEELNELQTTLKKLLKCNNDFKNDINRKTKDVRIQAKRAKSVVKRLRTDIDEMFDTFEKKINRSIDDIISMDETKLLNIETRVENISKDLNENILKISNYKTKGNMRQLFVTAKRAKQSVKIVSISLESFGEESDIQRYQFVPEPSIVEMLQNLTEIGRLDIMNKCAKVPKFEKDINVRFPCDDKECVITGVEIMSESIIIAADHTNESVKVVDTVNNYLASVHKLDGSGALIKPFDLVKTEATQIAVTYPYRRKIHLLELSDSCSLKVKKEMDMKNECFGIDRINDN
ncbi:uncharacterized protein LOC132721224 [Ruditapes philippinarum]|uniref:uncharacterized protein LOC132721224 n=1 Tax=Ruditapes philippinarum TaxID=129788 RepID=UPI00295B02F7|nr:uncharacterized protein LOC132721224 [Ruditapes philippinarum]